jgi:hypothetical protein
MATYDINGFTYRSPKELTESELLDLAKSLKASGALDPEVRNQEISGREELKSNAGLLDAYRTYYKRMNGEDFKGTNDELVGEYMQQMRDWNLNTGALAALSGRLAGNTFSEKERQSIAIMWDTWDRVVPFYRQKDGKWQGLVDSVQSIATDPTNLLGVFTAGTATAAGVAAREAAKLGVRQAVKAYAVQGVKSGAIQGAIDGAATNVLEQSVKTNIGRQDEFSLGELAGATALGAGAGGVLGGGLGAGQGALAGRRAVQDAAPTPDAASTVKSTFTEDNSKGFLFVIKDPSAPKWNSEKGDSLTQDFEVGRIVGNTTNDSIIITTATVQNDFQGKGFGVAAYEELAQIAAQQGKRLRSDSEVTESAVRVWESLEKRGYTVEKNPLAREVVEDGTKKLVVDNGSVFTVSKTIPANKPTLQTPRNANDARMGMQAAQQFSDAMNDEAVKGAARAQARQDFLSGVSDSSRRYFERSLSGGALNKAVSFEDAQSKVSGIFDRLEIQDYNNLTEVADKLEGAFNSGKLDVTDLSTFTAGVIGTETHAFRKFQEAYLNNAEDTVKAFEAYEKVARLSSHLSNQQARSTAFQMNRLRESVDPLTYAQAIELVAKSTGDLEAKTLQELLGNKLKRFGNVAVGALNEFWVYNILGSVKSLMANTFGAASMLTLRPAERILGGLLQGDSKSVQSALTDFTVSVSSLHQAAAFALKSFYTSKTYIDGRLLNETAEKGQDVFIGDKDLSIHQILMPQKYGWMNTLGNLNRFIGKRGMQATDELVKQMAFRGRVMGLAMDDAFAKGMNYADAWKYAREQSAKAIDDQLDAVAQGKKVDNPLAAKAIAYAQEVAFQNDMPDDFIGGIGKGVSEFRNKHPLFTQLVPFVRTPFNIIEFHSARLPVIQNFTDTIRGKIQAGGKQAQEAEAALHLGSLVTASAIMMAFTDQMEGTQSGTGFKTDPGKSGVLRGAGVEPNSILIDRETGERIRIDRLDPLSRHFTLMAKIKDIYKYGTKQDQDGVMAGLVAAFAANFAEMSTLGGIKEAIDLFQSETSMAQKGGNRLGTYVPYFRLLQDVWGEDYKVAYGVVDNIYKNVPGLNNNLDIRRNPVFGTVIERSDTFMFPMSPIPKTVQSNDPVDKELVRLTASVRPPEPKLFDGRIDLTKIKHPNGRSAYDRYQELAGLIKGPDGKVLYEKMKEVMEDPRYWSTASDPQNQIGVAEEGGKVAILKRVIKGYRDMALKELSSEVPGLKEQINKSYQDNKAANSITGQQMLEQMRANGQ